MREVPSSKGLLRKLSKLQRFILVALLEPRCAAMKRREFALMVYGLYYRGENSRSTRACLSRAYRRLEDRKYIVRCQGCWELTGDSIFDGGLQPAFLAWASLRDIYAQVGLRGPPPEALEALGIKAKKEARPGVRVELDCSML